MIAPTVLVVDDNDPDVEWCRITLRRSGRFGTVTHASDGLSALEMLSRPPAACVVLLDINMPRLSGLEVLARIKDAPFANDISVFMLTSSDDPKEAALANGYPFVHGFLQKPLSVETANGIADHCQKRQQ